jgi:putative hydrolase of the HAD superfamily
MNPRMDKSSACVVFDVDDTLYLERDYVQSGFRHVSRLIENRFGLSNFDKTAWELFVRGARGNIFNQSLSCMGIRPDAQLIAELVTIYRNHQPDISLPNDAFSCLELLKPNCKLALITDGPVECQQNKIRALGLSRWIPLRVATGVWSTEYSKPHPRAFIIVQRETNSAPGQCIYVADNPAKDFIAPRKLGWETVRIRRDEGLHAAVDSGPCAPHHEFRDLQPLMDLLRVQHAVSV